MIQVAVVGATGSVGRALLSCLSDFGFKAEQVKALASKKSEGKDVSFGEDDILKVSNLEHFDFSETDVAFFAAGSDISKTYAEKAAGQGCYVIDNSSYFRADEDVPLIVPEVNADHLKIARKRRLVANPNCSTIPIAVALKPLHDVNPVKHIFTSTYQSVSGIGKKGMDDLFNQSRSVLMGQDEAAKHFSKPIAFNVIPQIDRFLDDGSTKEEWKMKMEIKKILDPSIDMSVTCVRVPVFIGHSASVHISFEKPMSVTEATEIFNDHPHDLVMSDSSETFHTPQDVANEDLVYISRLREDNALTNGLAFWVVSDNLRKGAALNAVQILEAMIKQGFFSH